MEVLQIVRAHGLAVGLTTNSSLLIYFEQTPNLAAAQSLGEAAEKLVGHRERLTCLVVVGAGSGSPEPEVRSEIQRIIQKFEAQTDALAYAILSESFQGAAARAVVSGMLLFARPKFPSKVFADIPSALAWLAERKGQAKAAVSARLELEIARFCSSAGGPAAVSSR